MPRSAEGRQGAEPEVEGGSRPGDVAGGCAVTSRPWLVGKTMEAVEHGTVHRGSFLI